MLYTLYFALFFVFAIWLDFSQISLRKKQQVVIIIFVLLTFLVGIRNPLLWSDSYGYQVVFNEDTKTLATFSFHDTPRAYTEFGFYLLGVVLKSVYNNSTFYFVGISCLSFYFLYKFDKEYCMFPMIALCVYMGRFLGGRNMIQIRAGLAIPIVLLATKYAANQKIWKFLLVIAVGYYLHHSALMALPLYFINKVKISQKMICLSLAFSFGIALFLGGFIKSFITNFDLANELAGSYIQEGSEKAYSNSLLNPMIYYQSIILLIFTLNEKSLKPYMKYYYTIRNGYFYSTILLILLYQFAILAARTSTIFATYEMCMVPMFLLLFKRHKNLSIAILLFVYISFFYMNWKPAELSDIEMQELRNSTF